MLDKSQFTVLKVMGGQTRMHGPAERPPWPVPARLSGRARIGPIAARICATGSGGSGGGGRRQRQLLDIVAAPLLQLYRDCLRLADYISTQVGPSRCTLAAPVAVLPACRAAPCAHAAASPPPGPLRHTPQPLYRVVL